jgi:nucleoside-diphosphate-sugar epimerase
MMKPIQTIEELDDALSRPQAGVFDTLRKLEGDVVVLGASGKMGPSLVRMLRRALDELGHLHRRVIAVARFTSPQSAQVLRACGAETVACDLLDRNAVRGLPLAPNVFFMAGQKFGTSGSPELTWAMNTLVPANIAERYAESRIVVFSTGCVYPLVDIDGPGAMEDAPLEPPGEYSNSCVGRERVFEYFSKLNSTRVLLFRLCYAIDLRYGVLCDVATRVAEGLPVDVSMGAANIIWQGDACARAIQSLALASSPARALNVTGLERVWIRALAERFGELLGRPPIIQGEEGAKAWLWDARCSLGLFGPPEVNLEQMIAATANWIRQGGETLGKPTHFETTNGRY